MARFQIMTPTGEDLTVLTAERAEANESQGSYRFYDEDGNLVGSFSGGSFYRIEE